MGLVERLGLGAGRSALNAGCSRCGCWPSATWPSRRSASAAKAPVVDIAGGGHDHAGRRSSCGRASR